jgi:hypothetical protein
MSRGGDFMVPQRHLSRSSIKNMGRMADDTNLPRTVPAFTSCIMRRANDGTGSGGAGHKRRDAHQTKQRDFFAVD